MHRFVRAFVIAAAATSALSAETHQFIPTVFYTTYSFAHPPALRINLATAS